MATERTIFMIDDDVEDQEMFSETLYSVDQSIKCIKSSDGRQALQTLLKESVLPDYIFLDLNMPMMNGYEFLKEIKKHEKLNQIPVIIYTTSSESKHKDEVLNLGAASFITKPSDLSELKKLLHSLFFPVHHN